MLFRYLLIALFASLSTGLCSAQGTQADYDRSDTLAARYGDKVITFRPHIRWLSDGRGIWWNAKRDGKLEYTLVETPSGERRSSFEPDELGLAEDSNQLTPLARWRNSIGGGEATSVLFDNTFDRAVRLYWVDTAGRLVQYGEVLAGQQRAMATYAGHVWVLDFKADDLAGIFTAEAWPSRAVVGARSQSVAMRPNTKSNRPRPKARLRIRDHNVHLPPNKGEAFRLSTNGTSSDRYLDEFYWSPDKKHALAFQATEVETRRIPLIESSPDDQLQPKITWLDYPKPGDELSQRRPRLFNIGRKQQVTVEDDKFEGSFSVGEVHWASDSSRVFCLYNRRGHQQLAIRSINAQTGKVSTLVDERSETFIDYSQKSQRHWLDTHDQLLWASERDGHNHIYRYDTMTGKLINQVTRGAWVVRSIEAVDEARQQLWFMAVGIHADQDPYFQHLVRVNFDGSGLIALTEANGTHDCTLSEDRQYFIDRWSSVENGVVTELRDATTGALLEELGRDDTSALLASGYSPPEPFVAKGRDGETDIWGIIIRPSNFSSDIKYPVIEAIYAGPHGQFVPKSWGLQLNDRRIADLGFIVVRIDGMGTNWRSKSFHDVCWKNLKDAGFPDRIAWMRAAAKTRPEMDLSRVGIFGGSAGGQSALSALLHHGEFYKSAAADCGCHDNRMDKLWWNEAWMGVAGPHYAENSNATHAAQLTGHLLLTVGELDHNVDPASTMQVANALIRAGKDFELVVVPGAGHGIGDAPYLFRKRQDFFVRSLWETTPRH